MSNQNAEGGAGADSIDAWFDALSDPRRRSVCRYAIRTETDVVTHEELVDLVLERGPETHSDDRERRTVELDLRHTHLPKLDAIGVVEYDPRGETVRVDRATLTDGLQRVSETVDGLQEAGTDRDDE